MIILRTIGGILMLFLLINPLQAQVGIGTTNPQGALDIVSTNNGIVIPRIGLTSATDVTSVVNPDSGTLAPSTLIYNNGTGGFYPVGFYYWSGSNWQTISAQSGGDIKHGFQTADHNGWYLLDGRAISSLPANAQSAAAMIGLTGNLPNATNRVLKNTNGSEAIGSTTGSSTITLTQANLPNFDMTSTTNNSGNHNHSATTNNSGDHNHGYVDRGNSAGTYQTDGFGASNTTLVNPTFGNYTTDSAGTHNHTVTVNSNGNHNHSVTVNSGGSSNAIDNTPSSIVTNIFIYLGE